MSGGNGDGRIRGVFSTEEGITLGFGGTKRRTKQNFFVYVEEDAEGRIAVQGLNKNLLPSGPKTTIDREELLAKYLPEPAMWLNEVRPRLARLETHVKNGDQHRANGANYSAEFEYQGALELDEEHVRATFGLGLVYLERRDAANAVKVFKRLVKLKGAFEAGHRHLFNEFGIQLRKARLFGEALKYYARALEFSKDDEHLFYNMGRALFEKNDPVKAKKFLDKALRLNPDFPECREFLRVVEYVLHPRAGLRVRHGGADRAPDRGAGRGLDLSLGGKGSGRNAGRGVDLSLDEKAPDRGADNGADEPDPAQ